jgi:phage-related protein
MNEFVKKTQKTPKEEIQIAKDRKKGFHEVPFSIRTVIQC